MFNKVLEIKSTDDETRQLLAECCTAMNTEYVRMKKIKRVERVRNACGPVSPNLYLHQCANIKI